MSSDRPRGERVLRLASVLALIGLALMVWGVLDPRPMPVLVGLTIGQAIGTASFLLYLLVVASELGVFQRLRGEPKSPPPEEP